MWVIFGTTDQTLELTKSFARKFPLKAVNPVSMKNTFSLHHFPFDYSLLDPLCPCSVNMYTDDNFVSLP